MFCSATTVAAIARLLDWVPTMTVSFSLVMSRLASLAAACGSEASALTRTIFLPRTPPVSLIMSVAILMPSKFLMPFLAWGPVSGRIVPMRQTSWAAACPTSSARIMTRPTRILVFI